MREDARTPEQKERSKRVHALVMMILGAIMAACALAAGLIALTPGTFPAWMTGGRGERRPASYRVPAKPLVDFSEMSPAVLAQAAARGRFILLHLTPSWSREGRVMEETTYADPEVAAWIAENMIAVRADPEERADLARACDVGAWPATVLLSPDGRPLAAAARLTPKLLLPWARMITETIKNDPSKAAALSDDARRRVEAVRRRGPSAPGALDPVWGGVYRSSTEYAKILSDQASVVRSTDAARAKAVLAFVERFLALPGGGYAASMRGEVDLGDGRVEEGFSYFAKDDAARRAVGLPEIDRRIFPEPNKTMAEAISASPHATAAQKAHARLTLKRIFRR